MKLFETIRCEDGKVFNIEWHQRRYEESIQSFKRYVKLQLKDYIQPPALGLYRCKVVYSNEGIESVEYFPYKKREIKTLKLVEDNSIEYDLKFLDRSNIEQLFEKKGECDEIVIVKNGLLTDTSIANIALFDGSRWYTPKNSLLLGSTQARYIEAGVLTPIEIKKEDLANFSRLALLNAMIDFDIMPLYKIKGDVIVVK